MNRRGFLLGAGGILASFAAPAIVRADSLMRIVPVEPAVLLLRDLEKLVKLLKPWEVSGAQVIGQTFEVTESVIPAPGVLIQGCRFIFRHPRPAFMLDVRDWSSEVRECFFDGPGPDDNTVDRHEVIRFSRRW